MPRHFSARGKTRTKKQKGGKHIFSGTYGCGYSPAIRCEGNTDREPGVFSKLMSIEEARKEMAKREFLKPIDPEQQYFMYPLRSCRPDFEKLDPVENDIKVCSEHIEDFRSRGRLLQFRDGGDNLQGIKLGAADLMNFFRDFQTLFEGLVVLEKAKIAHLDIKLANIVCKRTDSGFSFHFIDFGFTVPIEEGVGEELPTTENYPPWPYEIKFTEPEFYTDEYSFERFADVLYKYLEYRKIDSNSIVNLDYNSTKNRFTVLNDLPLRNSVALSKVDVYSLGLALLELFTKFFCIVYRGGRADILKNGYYNLLSDGVVPDLNWLKGVEKDIGRRMNFLIRGMMNINYSQRFTATQSLALYKLIIPKIEMHLTTEKVRENLGVLYKGFASKAGGKRKTRKATH